MSKIPMLEKFAAQSLVEYDGELIFSKEKFAKLIVKECVNVLDPNGEYTEKYKHSHTPGPDGLRQILSQQQYIEMLASKKIKEHFGVE